MTTSMLEATQKLADTVAAYSTACEYKWVIGRSMAIEILRELDATSDEPMDGDGLKVARLVRLHGFRVEIDGPDDEVRFVPETH